MDLKHERELMRQGNNRRATGLTAKALFSARVDCAAMDAAVLGRCLLDRGLAPWAGADLDRSDLFETVSDQSVLLTVAVPAETLSPDALLIMLAA